MIRSGAGTVTIGGKFDGITIEDGVMLGVSDGIIRWVMTENGIVTDAGVASDFYTDSIVAPAERIGIETNQARCRYCNTVAGEDAYHKGTCANCGGVL